METKLLKLFGKIAGIGGLCVGVFSFTAILILRNIDSVVKTGKYGYLLQSQALIISGVIALAGLGVYLLDRMHRRRDAKESSTTPNVCTIVGKLQEETRSGPVLMQNGQVQLVYNSVFYPMTIIENGDYSISDVSIDHNKPYGTLWIYRDKKLLYKEEIKLIAPSSSSPPSKLGIDPIRLLKENCLQKEVQYSENESGG